MGAERHGTRKRIRCGRDFKMRVAHAAPGRLLSRDDASRHGAIAARSRQARAQRIGARQLDCHGRNRIANYSSSPHAFYLGFRYRRCGDFRRQEDKVADRFRAENFYHATAFAKRTPNRLIRHYARCKRR